MYSQEPESWQPVPHKGRIIALGVIRIVLSGLGMALSISVLIAGILVLVIKHNVLLGIGLVILGPLCLGLSITGLVLSIVSLARRVGTVRVGSARVRGMRGPPQ